MRPRRFSILAALTIIALGAFAVIVFALRAPRSDITQADHDRLRTGMTRVETERMLHGPPRNDVRRAVIVWVPQGGGKRISAELGPGDPSIDFFPETLSDGGDQLIWITETGLIAVYFGQDGRLMQTYFSTVHVLDSPTVLDWLATRPGMVRSSLGL